jgi:hypothetical protein
MNAYGYVKETLGLRDIEGNYLRALCAFLKLILYFFFIGVSTIYLITSFMNHDKGERVNTKREMVKDIMIIRASMDMKGYCYFYLIY